MMETKALAPSTREGGRWSNFSISGKEMSTCARPVPRRCASSSGSRCRVCGPKTTSTKGARRTISSPSWLATQPPTPIMRPGFARFRGRSLPEIGEHLLLRLLAHRAGVEENEVRLPDVVGLLVAVGGREHVGHLVRVVLVHLAAEGADVDLLRGHARLPVRFAGCASSSAGSPARRTATGRTPTCRPCGPATARACCPGHGRCRTPGAGARGSRCPSPPRSARPS